MGVGAFNSPPWPTCPPSRSAAAHHCRGVLPKASSLAWPDEPFRSEFLKLLKKLEMPRFTQCAGHQGRACTACITLSCGVGGSCGWRAVGG